MKKLFLVATILMICCFFSLWFFTLASNAPGGIRVEDIVLTTNPEKLLQEQAEPQTFDQTDQRIYAVIAPQSVLGPSISVELLVKWYYEDTQIASELLTITGSQPTTIWLDAPQDRNFRPGNYRLMIEVNRTATRTIAFVVK